MGAYLTDGVTCVRGPPQEGQLRKNEGGARRVQVEVEGPGQSEAAQSVRQARGRRTRSQVHLRHAHRGQRELGGTAGVGAKERWGSSTRVPYTSGKLV